MHEQVMNSSKKVAITTPNITQRIHEFHAE